MDVIDSFILAATTPTGETSGTLGGLILFITIAIAFSFLCSMLEAGLLSTPMTYIETKAQDGNRAGRWMQHAKENVDEPITAILTLNTFAHTVGAAGAGAQAVGVFGSQWAAVITFVLTLLILIFSEIIPKTVGAVYWKQLFAFNAYAIRILVLSLYPAVWSFKAMTRLITPEEKLPTITRAEIEMMAHISAEEGSLNENENRILRNLLHLNKVQVGDIMTPRTVVLAFQQDMTVTEVLETSKQRMLPYSRIPIYGENIDDITGFILRYDVLKFAAADRHEMKLRDFLRHIHAVPETLNITNAMDVFMENQQHILLVIDEYGGTAGVITMEDAMESLLGAEITDESDLVEDLRKLAQQRYERQQTILAATALKPTADGARPTEEVNEHKAEAPQLPPAEQPQPVPVDQEPGSSSP